MTRQGRLLPARENPKHWNSERRAERWGRSFGGDVKLDAHSGRVGKRGSVIPRSARQSAEAQSSWDPRRVIWTLVRKEMWWGEKKTPQRANDSPANRGAHKLALAGLSTALRARWAVRSRKTQQSSNRLVQENGSYHSGGLSRGRGGLLREQSA